MVAMRLIRTEKFFDGRRAAREWRSKYGPIYSIWSGFKPEIVLTKPEHVKAFYKDSHMHIKARDNNSGWLFGELLEAGDFLRSLNDSEEECIIINAANDLKYCPFFMVASIFFGELATEMRKELAALGPLREALFRDTFMGGISRYSIGKYLPGSAMSHLRDFQRRWETLVSIPTFSKTCGGNCMRKQLLDVMIQHMKTTFAEMTRYWPHVFSKHLDFIQSSTDVIVDAYAINVDNPYWKNPLKFDPSRHVGKKDNQARRYNMWRFGFGPRQCLGKSVADVILRVIIAELLKRYQLEAVQYAGTGDIELQAESWIGLPDGRVRLTPLPPNGVTLGGTV
ncbi:hypothetical protein VTI74DRAFT_8336 [Chaetomium olivicolor]